MAWKGTILRKEGKGMKKETLMELLRDYDSFYLYDEEVIREHTRRLKKDLPGWSFSTPSNATPIVWW